MHIIGRDRLPGTVNYFIGDTPKDWHTSIPTYAGVEYRDVYPGIDLVYRGAGGRLDYTWNLRPGAAMHQIRLQVTGVRKMWLDERGGLVMRGIGWSLSQPQPMVYQRVGGGKHRVPARFVLGSGWVGMSVGRYDRRLPLTIDPTLGYSTYLGSEGDQGLGIAVDATGSAYVVGVTQANPFPVKGAEQARNQGQSDAFIAKLNPTGNALVYSTYLGGSDADEAIAVAVDERGSAYLTGDTYSLDFPVLHGVQRQNRSACRGAFGGQARCDDAFVARLNPAGNALIYSTYLGGNGGDTGNGIALDSAGDAYVTGETDSSNFPTINALQSRKKKDKCFDVFSGLLASCSAAFVAKLDPSGSHLIYSTYLDGSSNDAGYDVAVDRAGDAYVTGPTTSRDFPTVKPIQHTLKGQQDAFVTEIDPAGRTLLYSTYLGGNAQTMGIKVAVDRLGAAYLTGWTRSSNFPTVNAFQRSIAPGTCSCVDAFVTKIEPSGERIAYSTYLGGTQDDEAFGIAVDNAGHAFIAGDTDSKDFPVVNAIQGRSAGQNEAFVAEIDRTGRHLIYSTYLGGSADDYGHGLALDAAGNAYVTGFTSSTNFPTLHGFQPFGTGVFVARIGNAHLRAGVHAPASVPPKATATPTRQRKPPRHGKCLQGQTLRRGKCVKRP